MLIIDNSRETKVLKKKRACFLYDPKANKCSQIDENNCLACKFFKNKDDKENNFLMRQFYDRYYHRTSSIYGRK